MKRSLVVLAACAACGGTEGEPIGGTIAIAFEGATITPTVGAAIADDGNAYIVIGTRDISCATTIQSQLKRGTYLAFSVEVATGMHAPFVSVIRVEASGTHLNGAEGVVTLDAVDGRIAGSVMVEASDAEIGAITVEGTFDVVRCF